MDKFNIEYALWETDMEKLFWIVNNLDKFNEMTQEEFERYIKQLIS